jgi:hypothetical protein
MRLRGWHRQRKIVQAADIQLDRTAFSVIIIGAYR